MHEAIRDFINYFQFNELMNAENNNPHKLLGPHLVENGLIICEYHPESEYVKVVEEGTGKEYYLDRIDDKGFYAVFIPESKVIKYKLEIKYYDGYIRSTYDPYSFEPIISDMDMYLFAEGTHYQIYEKLGAHVMTIDGVRGVHFAVWAPNARRVSVVGNFNCWDGRVHPMRVLGVSGIHELFIPDLDIGEIYKYEVKTRQGVEMLKSDPYMNESEYRPETASKVSDINDFEWTDTEWMDRRAKANRLDVRKEPMSVYELHLGSWKKKDDGTADGFYNYRELAHEVVEYIKYMGYTHIELMGIAEHPFDGSWGYQVTGYYAPTSRGGSPKDFMYFIDYMHKNGISVILDWVPAHFPKDAHGLARFDGEALYEHADSRRGEHPHWGTYIFNYGKKEVKNFLVANALFWIEKFHVDGLRVDAVASMLYLDYGKEDGQWLPNEYGGKENLDVVEFLKHLNSVLEDRNPGAIMIAEESTSWPGVTAPAELEGLGFLFKWNMGWMNDFIEYMKLDPYFRQFNHQKLTFGMMYAYSENFVLVMSHDEVVHGKCSMINKMPGEYNDKFANLRVAYGFMFGHPGKKLLFMGQEFAQWNEWSEARSLDWDNLKDDKNKQMQDYMKCLLHLYKEYSAFYINDCDPIGFEWMDCTKPELSVVSFIRRGSEKEEQLLFVCNFTPVTHEGFRVGVPCGGKYIEILNSDSYDFGGTGMVNIEPITAEEVEYDQKKHSISMNLGPLACVILKFDYSDGNEVVKENPVEKIAESVNKAVNKSVSKKVGKGKGKKKR